MRIVRSISLSMAAGLMLGCGFRGGGTPPPAAEPAPGEPQAAGSALQAPTRLVYTTDPAVYTKGAAISPNSPYVVGGAVASYRVSPALPAGLSLDPATGVISGTPTALAPAQGYAVTGANGAGSTTVTLSLAVNDTAPGLRPTVTLDPYLTAGASGLSASTQDQGAGVSYAWNLQGGTLVSGQGSPAITFTAGDPGGLTATVTVSNSGGSVSARADATVVPAPNATLTLPNAMEVLDGSKQASVPQQAGMTYTWAIVSGTSSATIRSGQGSNRIQLQAGGNPGTFQVQVKVQNQAGSYLTNSATVQIKSGY
jgi:hypothetical protein